jgi:hypothetical protein
MKIIALCILVLLIAINAQAYSAGYVRNNMKGGVRLESDSPNKDTWKDLVDAFLDGAEVDEYVANSTECVHDTEDTYEDMNEAIGHFIKRGWSWENWLDLNGALGSFTPFVRTCYDVGVGGKEDTMDYINSFDSLVDFAMQAKDNVVVHVFDWYDVIAKFNDAFSRGRNKDVAYQVGRALNLFLIFKPRSAPVQLQAGEVTIPDFRWAEEFLKGFLNGTKVLSSDRVKHCVNETEFMVESIEDANAQFKKKTEESYREGVFELADMFEHLKPLNEECYYGVADVEATVKKYIKTFKSPIDIAINAARHFNELYSDGLALIQHFKNDEWYSAGYDSGDILYNIFFDH